MKLLAILALSAANALDGSIFFRSLATGDLIRLDCADGCGSPIILQKGLAPYGALLPWENRLVAAVDHHVVTLDPWCQKCPMSPLVDVKRALAGRSFNDSFSVRGMTWCQDALFVVFAGPGSSGVLRCTCGDDSSGDCTETCRLVDGGPGLVPGKGTKQLSSFAASITCLNDQLLVADNSNFRLQALAANCTEDCEVKTWKQGLKYPLGLVVVKDQLIVTLDEGIMALRQGVWRNFSQKGDTGFVCEGPDGLILVASGGDGNVISFDPSCEGPDCSATVLWNSSHTVRAGTSIAFMRKMQSVLV